MVVQLGKYHIYRRRVSHGRVVLTTIMSSDWDPNFELYARASDRHFRDSNDFSM